MKDPTLFYKENFKSWDFPPFTWQKRKPPCLVSKLANSSYLLEAFPGRTHHEVWAVVTGGNHTALLLIPQLWNLFCIDPSCSNAEAAFKANTKTMTDTLPPDTQGCGVAPASQTWVSTYLEKMRSSKLSWYEFSKNQMWRIKNTTVIWVQLLAHTNTEHAYASYLQISVFSFFNPLLLIMKYSVSLVLGFKIEANSLVWEGACVSAKVQPFPHLRQGGFLQHSDTALSFPSPVYQHMCYC